MSKQKNCDGCSAPLNLNVLEEVIVCPHCGSHNVNPFYEDMKEDRLRFEKQELENKRLEEELAEKERKKQEDQEKKRRDREERKKKKVRSRISRTVKVLLILLGFALIISGLSLVIPYGILGKLFKPVWLYLSKLPVVGKHYTYYLWHKNQFLYQFLTILVLSLGFILATEKRFWR